MRIYFLDSVHHYKEVSASPPCHSPLLIWKLASRGDLKMFSASVMPTINWIKSKTGTHFPALPKTHAVSEKISQFPSQPVKPKAIKKELRDTDPGFLLERNLPQ